MWLSLKILTLLLAINFAPPLLAYFLEERWNTPLDLGCRFLDGRPVFGPHKTFRGFLGALGAGVMVGLIFGFPWWVGFGAALLSMAGDLASSFIKRRFGISSGTIVPALDQVFEGLFPFLMLKPYLLLGTGHVLVLLGLFGFSAYLGSLFLKKVLLEIPFENYPRLLRPRVRFKEFRACQATSTPLRYFLNFEEAFYYHIFMKTVLRLMGVYERGKHNALQIKTTNISFYFNELPNRFEGYTILFLSDLHLDGLDGLTERVQALVRMHPVDLCIIGGDLRMDIHGPFTEALSRLRCLVSDIRAKDGIISVMGNHDCLEMVESLNAYGMSVLVNDATAIKMGGQKIWIVGVDDPHYFKCHDLEMAFADVPHGAFKIFVAHSNEIYREAAAFHPQLYLCGHTHGGQILVPFLGAPFTHSKAPRSFLYGPWKYQRMIGYTSCGVGVSGVPVRFSTHGEILLITLKKSRDPHPAVAAPEPWVLSRE